MNSCRSIELSACTPPLMTFIIGTGNVAALSPPRYLNSESPASAAHAFAVASDTPRIAFAPRRPLFGVPSSSMRAASRPAWSSAARPRTASAISPLTLATARPTPLPPHSAAASRSSTASCAPVEAPEGTAARPNAPESRRTSTSTVGLPRESRICLPRTSAIVLTAPPSSLLLLGQVEIPILLLERESRPVVPVGRGELLGALDALAEPPACAPELELGIDVEPPGDVDRGEQEVPELRCDSRVRLGLGRWVGRRQLPPELVELALEVAYRCGDVGVLEADCRRPPLHLARDKQRRQRLRDVVEDALAALVLALDPLPVRAHPSRRLGLDLPEDVRVALHELRVDRARRLLEVAGAALLQEQGEEVALEEQVAELVEELCVVAAQRRVGDLVGLLDGVRDDRLRRLLAIPRAIASQPLCQRLQLDERVGERPARGQPTAPCCPWSRSAGRRGPGSACSRPGT